MSNITDYPQPQIHLNGTGRDSLTEETVTAHNALHAALQAFHGLTTHPRDYYVLDDVESYEKALTKQMEMGKCFRQIEQYLDDRLAHLMDL